MSLCQQLKNDQSNILCNFGDVTMSDFKVIWEGAGGGGGVGLGGRRRTETPLSRSQESQKCPVLIGLVQFDSILSYFLIIISIHFSKSFILFLNFFDSRSKWYWSTSKEKITMKPQLSALLDNNKAENVSRNRASCFMVTNRSTLEMDECGARHYYICEKYRGTLKKMDI